MSVKTTIPEPTAIVYGVYSIRDVKTNTYSSPFVQTHKAGAMRMFADLCSDPQSSIARHPEDYQLFMLATFNSESGLITPNPDGALYLASPSDFNN